MILLLSACGDGRLEEDGSLSGTEPDVTSQTAESFSETDNAADGITPDQPADGQPPEDETATPGDTAFTPEPSEQTPDGIDENQETGEEDTEMKMNVQIGASVFTATLEDNAAVDALVEMMEEAPVTIQMSDYAGFEKVGPLGTSLPTSNSQTTTQAGDIVLYQGNQIVIFYGSNSWSYTRLGRIDDLTGWADALGSGDVTVSFSIGE